MLIGVDGGADALLEIGSHARHHHRRLRLRLARPHWRVGADLVHHVHPDGRAPGRESAASSGVSTYQEFVAEGTSEDVAMLLAAEGGAQLIVAVGTHATMVEFLDKGRPGMASTFLTRLRLGPMLVDAKGVSKLYEGRVRRLDLVLLVGVRARRHHHGDRRLATRSTPSSTAFRVTVEDLWYSITGMSRHRS